METIFAATAFAATLFFLVGAHGLGHYAAGRAIGLPHGVQKILFGLPVSYVALRVGNDRVSPEDTRYRAAIGAFVPYSGRRVFAYGAGRMIGQTGGRGRHRRRLLPIRHDPWRG